MTSKLTFIAASALLLLGTYTASATDNAPGGTGVIQSTEGKGATNKDTSNMSGAGAGSMQGGGASTANQPGTGVEQSSQGEGAGDKQGMDDADSGNMGGASSGNAVGGTGVESSSQGEGTKNKTSN